VDYEITTEDRGHGIIAVYAEGPDTEIAEIDRAILRYARKELEVPGGPTSSGGSFTSGPTIGAPGTYKGQMVFITKPLPPRQD
jgi:hypothetical protein